MSTMTETEQRVTAGVDTNRDVHVVRIHQPDAGPPGHRSRAPPGVISGLHRLANGHCRGAAADLPDGDLYLHIDIDVCDPQVAPGLLFPRPVGRCSTPSPTRYGVSWRPEGSQPLITPPPGITTVQQYRRSAR